jgi:nucleotide-binding universal stress UspA family protein
MKRLPVFLAIAEALHTPHQFGGMISIKRLLIGLDFTETDRSTIEYTASLAESVGAERAYFIHVIQQEDEELEESISEQHPEMHTSLDETIQDRMRREIEEHFKYRACETQLELKSGNVVDTLVKWTRYIEPDLVVMGMKNSEHDANKSPASVARIINRPVLLVNQEAQPKFERIAIATDFSKFTFQCIQEAEALTQNVSAEIRLFHAYRLPTGYHNSGKSESEFCRIMEENAQKKAHQFFEEFELDTDRYPMETVFVHHKSRTQALADSIEAWQADMLILGSRGRSQVAQLFLGSVATHFINLKLQRPLLIVKDRKGSLSFLDALSQI